MKRYAIGYLWALVLLLAGCGSIDLSQIARPISRALHDPSATALARHYQAAMQAHPGQSGFSLLDDGLQALAARLDLVDRAEKTVDLQYYIVRSDRSGLLLLRHLLAAADRGVRVRILIDALHFSENEQPLFALENHPNISVRLINPFINRYSLGRLFEILTDFDRIQRRMHNKVFIADNTVAILGGRNLGDEYFETHPRLDLRDIDLRIVGPIVRQLSVSFDSYWNFRQTLPMTGVEPPLDDHALQQLRTRLKKHRHNPAVTVYLRQLDEADKQPKPPIWASGKLLVDFPCKLNPGQPACTQLSLERFYALFGQTRSELLIISPYFIPGTRGIALFYDLAQHKAKVRILTNAYAATDLKIVQAGYNRYRQALLEAGVELYEFKPTSPAPMRKMRENASFTGASQACMHAKAYVMDRRRVFVGSFNHDPRSATFNTEIGILIDSPALAAQVARLFDNYTSPANSYHLQLQLPQGKKTKVVWRTEENGKETVYHQEPMVSWWQHLKSAALGLLAPEGWL